MPDDNDPFDQFAQLAHDVELLAPDDRVLLSHILEALLAADPNVRRDEWGFFERCARFQPDSEFGKHLSKAHQPFYRVIIPALDSLAALLEAVDRGDAPQLESVTAELVEANLPALGGPAGMN